MAYAKYGQMGIRILEQKIAHLGMIQGVIGRMASDSQTLKTLAITVAAAIIALGQTQGPTQPGSTPSYLPLIAVFRF
jgi:phage FluMu protein gp41